MLPLKEFYSINESEKGSLYADRMIRFIRQNMQPLVNAEHAQLGLDYLLGLQSMRGTESLFLDPSLLTNAAPDPLRPYGGLVDKSGLPIGQRTEGIRADMKDVLFKSMPVLIKAKNIVVDEMKKMGVVTNVRANDPTSSAKRKADETLMKNKQKYESMLTYIYTSLGEAPVSLSDYKERFGEKHDSGNTADIEKMGLNPGDPDDLAFFFSLFYKLDWEIEMESAINSILSFNEVSQNNIERWTIDILSKNAGALQVYVSDDNGAIVIDYLTPETVYVYSSGRRKDYNDAVAKCYEQSVTIKEFLDRVGSAFNFEEHIEQIMMAVFYASSGSVDITGINPDWRGYSYGGEGGGGDGWYCQGRGGTKFSHNEFMNFKVTLGYMEWTSQNYTQYGEQMKATTKEFKNNKGAQKEYGDGVGFATEDNQPAGGEKYPTKARYECPTYKSYYLALTSFNHLKFKFGKATYQDIKGYNDFNQNFSIITYKEIGDPLAIMAIPLIDIINEAFYKWRYILRKSKAPGTDYNLESLTKIADIIFCDTDSRENRIQKTIQFLDVSSNRLWAFPEIEGKPSNYTFNQLNIPVENGLSDNFMKYWEAMTVAWDKLIDMLIGQSDLRQGDSPVPRAGVSNEFKALEASQNTTSYLPYMITYFCRTAASKVGLFIQDIIQYKNYDTLAYKFLEDLSGDEALDKIENMGKTALQRYGINIESLNQSARFAKLSQRIDFAIQNGTLTNAQALLIEDIKSTNLAYRTLAFFEQRNNKIKQQQQVALQKQATDQALQIEKEKQNTERIKGEYQLADTRIKAQAGLQDEQTKQQGQLERVALKQQGDINQSTHEAILDLRKNLEMLANNQLKTNTPILPPLPQGPQGPTPTQIPQQGANQPITPQGPAQQFTQQ